MLETNSGRRLIGALDNQELKDLVETLGTGIGPNFDIRFKELGEMPSKYLKETTLDPATRILLRVDIKAQLEADKTFQQLLGKDPSQRYEVIISEANLVEDLDI